MARAKFPRLTLPFLKAAFAAFLLAACVHGPAALRDPAAATSDATFIRAFEVARREHKPVLAYWSARWCKRCYDVKHEVFADPAVAAKLSQFVMIALDWDDPATQQLAQKWQVEGIPTVTVLSAQGELLERLSGAALNRKRLEAL